MVEGEDWSYERQAAEQRNARADARDGGDGQATDDSSLAVSHQKLVGSLLGVDGVAEVGGGQDLQGRALGLQLHQDLPVAGDMWRHVEADARLLELHRRRWCLTGRTQGAREVHHAHRDLLTNQDFRALVVQGLDQWLRLHVGELHALQRSQEAGEAEPADGGAEDQVQRRVDDGGLGVGECRHRIAAQVHHVDARLIGLAALQRIGALDNSVEKLIAIAEVIAQAERLEVGPVHEDQLGLDRDAGGTDIQPANEVLNFRHASARVSNDQRVAGGIGVHITTTAAGDGLDGTRQGTCPLVVDPHHAGHQRFKRVELGQRGGRIHAQDATRHLLH